MAIRQARSSSTPTGTRVSSGMAEPITRTRPEVCPAADDAAFAKQTFVYCSWHGEGEIALRLPGLRVGVASVAGAMPRLRRMEHARPGSGRSVEHLRRQAQSPGRRARGSADRAGNARGAARAAAER